MIRFEHVTITYPDATAPALADVHLEIPEGELVLVVGATGSGKTTLLRAINGLVPHFTGRVLAGRVLVGGRDTRTHPPRDLADLVGVVMQDPAAGFVADTLEEELAYGMECLGLDGDVMRRRVEETLDLLGLAPLRDRAVTTLSAGEQQRLAIGAVLTAHPRILVLDEPTSALDPAAAEEVLAALQRLVHDLGVTVVMAEHRLERVVQYADRVLIAESGRIVDAGPPQEAMLGLAIAPPVVELGRMAGWRPLPLSVRDARRAAGPLRDLLLGRQAPLRSVRTEGDVAVDVHGVEVRYGRHLALRSLDLSVRRGQVVAVMGRNGAGKSTLLRTLVGLQSPARGTVRLHGQDPANLSGEALVHAVGFIPQDPSDLLESSTVAGECRAGDRDAGVEAGTTRALLALLAPDISDATHPNDLSEGQRLLLALAIVLSARPPVLLLDEPTRGLDYPTKQRLAVILRDLAAAGHAVLLATHDVELCAEVASHVVVLADGEIVATGPAHEVVLGSPLFAPQVAKVLAPGPWLTVSEVATALAEGS